MVQVQIRIELVLGKVILPSYAYKAIKKQNFTENYKLICYLINQPISFVFKLSLLPTHDCLQFHMFRENGFSSRRTV